jgi:hypothetical protein
MLRHDLFLTSTPQAEMPAAEKTYTLDADRYNELQKFYAKDGELVALERRLWKLMTDLNDEKLCVTAVLVPNLARTSSIKTIEWTGEMFNNPPQESTQDSEEVGEREVCGIPDFDLYDVKEAEEMENTIYERTDFDNMGQDELDGAFAHNMIQGKHILSAGVWKGSGSGQFSVNKRSLGVHRTAAKSQAELEELEEEGKVVREAWTQATKDAMNKAAELRFFMEQVKMYETQAENNANASGGARDAYTATLSQLLKNNFESSQDVLTKLTSCIRDLVEKENAGKILHRKAVIQRKKNPDTSLPLPKWDTIAIAPTAVDIIQRTMDNFENNEARLKTQEKIAQCARAIGFANVKLTPVKNTFNA